MKLTIIVDEKRFVEAEMADDLAIAYPTLFREMFDTLYEEVLAQLNIETNNEH